MKIKLLNDGNYGCLNNVDFPVIVEGEGDSTNYVMVKVSELYRISKNPYWDVISEVDVSIAFHLGTQCEIMESK